MSIIDPISDMLTRIRNAYKVGNTEVSFGISKIKLAILDILRKNHYIESYNVKDGQVIVTLYYPNESPAITAIERVSRPGRRIYIKSDEIPNVLSGHGIAIISTSKGIMTGEEAKKVKIGGEYICRVY